MPNISLSTNAIGSPDKKNSMKYLPREWRGYQGHSSTPNNGEDTNAQLWHLQPACSSLSWIFWCRAEKLLPRWERKSNQWLQTLKLCQNTKLPMQCKDNFFQGLRADTLVECSLLKTDFLSKRSGLEWRHGDSSVSFPVNYSISVVVQAQYCY